MNGRCDAVCENDSAVYIFEFKMESNGCADDALRQIDTNRYADPYLASGKNIVKIGVVFSGKSRSITEYKVS